MAICAVVLFALYYVIPESAVNALFEKNVYWDYSENLRGFNFLCPYHSEH